MKKKGIPYGLLAFATLWLLYDVYYWSMRSSAGVLRNIDVIICITSGLICVFVIFSSSSKKLGKGISKKPSFACFNAAGYFVKLPLMWRVDYGSYGEYI